MPQEQPDERKVRILGNFYFVSSDIQQDDFNPYEDKDVFLKSKVGSMRWGRDPDVRKRSKERYSLTLHGMLHAASIELPQKTILQELENDDQTNLAACEAWANTAQFPVPHP
jgi:hypothetical protein